MDRKKLQKDAFKAYGERVGEWLPVSLALLIVLACCAALSLLGSLWMLFGIGLLFLPTLFAATQYLAASLTEKPAQTNLITHAFGAYFRPPCLGVYRFFFNAFMTLLATMGVGIAFVMVYYLVASLADPSFAALSDSIASAINAGDYETATSTMNSSPLFAAMYDYSEMAMGYALVFFAWLFYGHYAQNGILRNAFHLDNARLANFYYSHYRVIVKKDWIPTRAPFLLFPLAFMGIGLATSILCYAFGVKLNFAIFFGLLSFAFLYALYLPLGIYLHALFAFAHESSVGKAFYQGSEKIYNQYASMGRASEEELAKMREELDRMKPKDDEDEKE